MADDGGDGGGGGGGGWGGDDGEKMVLLHLGLHSATSGVPNFAISGVPNIRVNGLGSGCMSASSASCQSSCTGGLQTITCIIQQAAGRCRGLGAPPQEQESNTSTGASCAGVLWPAAHLPAKHSRASHITRTQFGCLHPNMPGHFWRITPSQYTGVRGAWRRRARAGSPLCGAECQCNPVPTLLLQVVEEETTEEVSDQRESLQGHRKTWKNQSCACITTNSQHHH